LHGYARLQRGRSDDTLVLSRNALEEGRGRINWGGADSGLSRGAVPYGLEGGGGGGTPVQLNGRSNSENSHRGHRKHLTERGRDRGEGKGSRKTSGGEMRKPQAKS